MYRNLNKIILRMKEFPLEALGNRLRQRMLMTVEDPSNETLRKG